VILEYQELNDQGLLDKVDGISRNTNVIELDLNEILSNKLEIKEYDYAEALRRLTGVEAKEAPKPEVPLEAKTVPKAPESEEILRATKEIKELVGSFGKEFEKNIMKEVKRIKGGKFILPTLSLQDQISELEKISEGIDEQVFSEEQMKIIKEEVRGLEEKLKTEKISVSDEFQKSLIALRNQRLNEVIKKIS
jgi:hypothetical protein